MKDLRLYFVMTVFALVFAFVVPSIINGQFLEPAPAPSSDGVAIDQGVAYVLMLVALAITYIIH
ncbi:hypothetical protein OROGR_018489 [Orobanche gracilis]